MQLLFHEYIRSIAQIELSYLSHMSVFISGKQSLLNTQAIVDTSSACAEYQTNYPIYIWIYVWSCISLYE